MPPVVAAVAVIAAQGAVAAGLIAASTAMLVTAAATAGTFLYLRGAMEQPSVPDAESRQQMEFESAPEHRTIYGECKVSGPVIATEEKLGARDDSTGTWKGEVLHFVQVLAHHRINRVSRCCFGKEKVLTTDSGGMAADGNMTFKTTKGDQTAASPIISEMSAAMDCWYNDMVATGCPLVWWQGIYDREVFPRGFEGLAYVVEGKPLYDPRTQTTKYSANSALVVLDFLLQVFKVPLSEINVNSFIVAANLCDESVPYRDSSGAQHMEPRYRANGVYYHSSTYLSGLSAILDTCAGKLIYDLGYYSLYVGAYYGPATKTLTETSLAGDVVLVPWLSEKDHFNTINGTFVSPHDFVETDFTPVSDPDFVSKDGKVISRDVSFPWVSSASQAQRLAKIQLLKGTRASVLTWPCNFMGIYYSPGDMVEVTLSELGIISREFMVVKREFVDGRGITLTLESESVDFYGDATAPWPDFDEITNLPDGSTVYPPIDLSYNESAASNHYQGVLTWDHAAKNAVNFYTVEVYKNGNLVLTSEALRLLEYRVNALDVGDYQFTVYATNNFNKRSSGASLAFTVSTPQTPIGCDITEENFVVILKPKVAGSLSYQTNFEYYYSLENDANTKIFLGRGRTLEHGGLPPLTTIFYWIRTVNAYGASSFYATSATTTAKPDDILQVIGGSISVDDLDQNAQDLINQLDTNKPGNIIDKVEDIVNDALAGLTPAYVWNFTSGAEGWTGNLTIEEAGSIVVSNGGSIEVVGISYEGKDNPQLSMRIRFKTGFTSLGTFAATFKTATMPFDTVTVPVSVVASTDYYVVKLDFETINEYISGVITGLKLYFSTGGNAITVIDQITVGKRSSGEGWGEKITAIEQEVDELAGKVGTTITAVGGITTELDDHGQELIAQEFQDHQLRTGQTVQGLKLAKAEETLEANVTETEAIAQKVLNLTAVVGDNSSQISQVSKVVASNTQAIATTQNQLNSKIDNLESDINEKFRTTIGYCVDKDGNITSHETAVLCVAAGNTWQEKPLAEVIRNMKVTTADGKTASLADIAQVFEDVDGELVARGGFLFDVDGRVSGLVATADGAKTTVDIITDAFALTNPDTGAHDVYWDAQKKTMVIRGRLILGDGTIVDGVDEIAGEITVYCYRSAPTKPTKPTGIQFPPAGWSLTPTPNSTTDFVWATTATKKVTGSTILGSWSEPVQWSGKDGMPGSPGSVLHAIPNATGVFPTDTATVNALFKGSLGRDPRMDDHLTIYKSSDPSIGETKRYNDTAWVAPNFLLTGDMLVKGTITGDRLVAGTEITAPSIRGGDAAFGLNGPYNGYNTFIQSDGTLKTNRLYLQTNQTGSRLEVSGESISVYQSGALRVRIGRLS